MKPINFYKSTSAILNRTAWKTYAVIAIIVILLRLPSVIEPLDNDSGALAYHARLILRGEPLYSTYHTGHHLPAGYYSYALSFLLFGDQAAAPKLLLIPWIIGCAWVLYRLGKVFADHTTGLLASIFFAILTSQVYLKGMTAEIELFANLPLSAGVFAALYLHQKRLAAWKFAWVGMLAALAFLYKAVNIAPFAISLVLLLGNLWVGRRELGSLKAFFNRLFWLGLGFAIPLLLVTGYFASQGLLGRFLAVFQYGWLYVRYIPSHLSEVKLPIGIFPILYMAVNNPALLILGLVGSIRLLRAAYPLHNEKSVTHLGLAFWLYLSMLQAGITGVGFAQYVLLVVPPLAWVGALEIKALGNIWQQKWPAAKVRVLQGALMVAVVGFSLAINSEIYLHYAKYTLGQESYQSFLTGHFGTGKIHLRVAEIAQFIRERTTYEDVVYYWGQDVQFYYLADRRASADFIWPEYIEMTGINQGIFTNKPKYVIVARQDRLEHPAWLLRELEHTYVLEKVISGEEIYRRRE